MPKVASVHFSTRIKPHLQHNDRTDSRSDTIHKDLSHLNECDKSAKEATKQINKLYDEALKKLKEAKVKRKTPKENAVSEAIIEIESHTTMAEVQELADKIAEMTGFTKVQVTIHRDEGKEGKGIHYHAHAVFFTLDKETGKQLARREKSLSDKMLSDMQTEAARILKMERGEQRYGTGKKAKKYTQDFREFARIQETTDILMQQKEAELRAELEQEYSQKQEKLEQEYQTKDKELEIKKEAISVTEKAINDFKSKHRNITTEDERFFQAQEKEARKGLFGFFLGGHIIEKYIAPLRFSTYEHRQSVEYNAEERAKERIEKIEQERDRAREQVQAQKKEIIALKNERWSLRTEIDNLNETISRAGSFIENYAPTLKETLKNHSQTLFKALGFKEPVQEPEIKQEIRQAPQQVKKPQDKGKGR